MLNDIKGISLGSILPVKFKSVLLNNLDVSLTKLFPFPSSDPTLSIAILGLSTSYIFFAIIFPNAAKSYSIGTTKEGHPRHPLYASYKDVLMPFQNKN